MEVAFLEEANFHLPRHALVENGGGDPNANDIPIPKHNNKIVHRVPPRKDHDSKWLFGKHSNATFLRM
jgi:hypothetical protein